MGEECDEKHGLGFGKIFGLNVGVVGVEDGMSSVVIYSGYGGGAVLYRDVVVLLLHRTENKL